MTKIKDQNIVRVAVISNYLTENFAESERYKERPEALQRQIEKYGYDPKNLNGVSAILTPKKRLVMLYAPNQDPTNFDIVRASDLAIYGSTEWAEDEVASLKNSGVVVARYSIFYGKESGYSGRKPEEGGYSLDLPKAVGCAASLITNDNCLEALASRDEARIRDAIGKLNVGHEGAPVLITPFLSEALKIQRGR